MTTMTPAKIEQYRAFRRAGLTTIAANHRAVAEARFEDLEFMLSNGETVTRALQRLGCRRDALQVSARTWGRPDIIELLKQGDR